MKRLLVLFAVLVPLSFFVAGCGGTGGSSGSKGTVAKEEQEKMKAAMAEQMAKMKGGTMPVAPGK